MLVPNKNSSEFNSNPATSTKSTFMYDSKTDSKCNNSDDEQPLTINKPSSASTAHPSTIKKHTTIVDAVVLHRSGTTSQIKFNTNTTLKQASTILDGHPTIIGEFESLGVIILRPAHHCCGCKYGQNKHRLPFPFQNEKYCGDYLLYKIDSACVAKDFTVHEYREFEQQMRDKTTDAYLNYKQNGKIEETQETSLNGILSQNTELLELWKRENVNSGGSMSLESFNKEMSEALENVRRIGRLDGQRLASSLAKTFCDINGREPELNEMANIFRRIKHTLENDEESDTDVDDDGTAKYMADKIPVFNEADGKELVEYAMRFVTEDLISRGRETFFLKNGYKPNNYDLRFEMLSLFESSVIDSQTDRYEIQRSAETDEDSDYNPENVADQELLLADIYANEEFEKKFNDVQLKVEQENMFVTAPTETLSTVQMLSTPVKNKNNSSRYNLYFNESPNGNLEKAKAKFSKMHKRKPTEEEIKNLKEFMAPVNAKLLTVAGYDVSSSVVVVGNGNSELESVLVAEKKSSDGSVDDGSVDGGSVDELQMVEESVHIMTTPVKENRNSARYNLYFDDCEDNAVKCEKGLEWFRKMCGRQPTDEEMDKLSQFVSTDKSVLFDEKVSVKVPVFDVEVHVEEDENVVDVD